MKILVVTSEVTFVPENYNLFLEGLFSELQGESDLTIDLVVLKNNSWDLRLKGLLLILAGGRHIGFHLLKNSLKSLFKDRRFLTKKYQVNLHYFSCPNKAEFHEFVKQKEIDLLINARTRFIYKNKILKIPKLGSLNIHHGLLPDYRGTMCDLWALYENRPTGFSIHVMEKKIDDGAIIRRFKTSIAGDSIRKNFATLIKESSKREGLEMAQLIKTINKDQKIPIEENNISLHPIYSKNPDFFTIRKMLQKGIEL